MIDSPKRAVALAIAVLQGCSRSQDPGNTDLQREADDLRARTMPVDAKVLSSVPATMAGRSVGQAAWELETVADWTTYRAWLRRQLRDYTCVGPDADPGDRVSCLRPMATRNEMWTVVVEPVATERGHRVRVEFRVLPQ